MGSALSEQQTISPRRKMSIKGLAAITLITSISLVFNASAGLEMQYDQTFQTNGVSITSDLWIHNITDFGSATGSFYQQNIPAGLAERGCSNMTSQVKQWEYKSLNENESRMVTNYLGWLLKPGQQDIFNYTIPANQVLGWEDVGAEMVAPAGSILFLYTVPLTRSTYTSNGVPLGALVDSGLATNMSSRAEYESASQVDGNSNSVPDALDWLIGGSTNYTGDFSLSFATTNGSPLISWTPAVSNRTYTIYSKTNLFDAAWIKSGTVTNDSGSVDSYIFTNDLPSAFYKIDISLP